MKQELAELYEHIDDIEIAMMTTRRADGHLQSRAMATQKRAAGADLWFVTNDGTQKLRDLAADPHVNLSYYKDRTREWVSVSGIAAISRERQKIHELYAPDWRAWFPDEGDPRHGTKDDPRLVLIGVDVHAAVFLEVNKPQPVVLFEVIKAGSPARRPTSVKCITFRRSRCDGDVQNARAASMTSRARLAATCSPRRHDSARSTGDLNS